LFCNWVAVEFDLIKFFTRQVMPSTIISEITRDVLSEMKAVLLLLLLLLQLLQLYVCS